MLVKRAPGIQSFWFAYHNDVPWASWRLCNRFRTKNILILCSIAPLLISVPLKIWRSVRLRFSIRYIPFKAKENLVKNIPLAWNIVLLSLALLTWFSPNIPYVYWTYSNQVRCNFNQFTQGTFLTKCIGKCLLQNGGHFVSGLLHDIILLRPFYWIPVHIRSNSNWIFVRKWYSKTGLL